MVPFYQEPRLVRPLPEDAGMDWSERNRYDYWPAGAEQFANLIGVKLPDVGVNRYERDKWGDFAAAWVKGAPRRIWTGHWCWAA